MSLNGRADCVFDLPEHKVTIVFEFKFEASSNPKKLDAKLAEALKQIKKRKYVLDGNSQPKVARFGLVFCAAKGERGFARVGKASSSRNKTAAQTTNAQKASTAATKVSRARTTAAQTTTAQNASTKAESTSPTKRKKSQSTVTKDKA